MEFLKIKFGCILGSKNEIVSFLIKFGLLVYLRMDICSELSAI